MAEETTRVGGFNRYLQETRSELRKVVWPTRQEAMNLTAVVLVVTVAMTIILSSFDWMLSSVLNYILALSGS